MYVCMYVWMMAVRKIVAAAVMEAVVVGIRCCCRCSHYRVRTALGGLQSMPAS